MACMTVRHGCALGKLPGTLQLDCFAADPCPHMTLVRWLTRTFTPAWLDCRARCRCCPMALCSCWPLPSRPAARAVPARRPLRCEVQVGLGHNSGMHCGAQSLLQRLQGHATHEVLPFACQQSHCSPAWLVVRQPGFAAVLNGLLPPCPVQRGGALHCLQQRHVRGRPRGHGRPHPAAERHEHRGGGLDPEPTPLPPAAAWWPACCAACRAPSRPGPRRLAGSAAGRCWPRWWGQPAAYWRPGGGHQPAPAGPARAAGADGPSRARRPRANRAGGPSRPQRRSWAGPAGPPRPWWARLQPLRQRCSWGTCQRSARCCAWGQLDSGGQHTGVFAVACSVGLAVHRAGQATPTFTCTAFCSFAHSDLVLVAI